VAAPTLPHDPELLLRSQLSSLQGLLALTLLMTQSGDERRILELAASSTPSLGRVRLEGVHIGRGWKLASGPCAEGAVQAGVDAQLATLGGAAGRVEVPGRGWAWAFSLSSLEGHFGYLVMTADEEPPPTEQFLLRVLSQQTGIALTNAWLHERHRAAAESLRAANSALAETVAALERKTAIHARLTRVAVQGEGQQGIADAVHQLTGFGVAIEDRHGNLLAWAGPGPPEPTAKDPPDRRALTLRRLREGGQPAWEAGRLVAIATPREDLLGVIALVDPSRRAGPDDHIALEHGATVLAMELARLQSVVETELRLGRDLMEELLTGGDGERTVALARALGYDIERPHRVVIVECGGTDPEGDALFHAVRRAARDCSLGSLMGLSRGVIVVLAEVDRSWSEFRSAVLSHLTDRQGRCRVGVGGVCQGPAGFPRSHREATLALKMQDAMRTADGSTVFDDLGIYRMLAEVEDTSSVERFVREWLGPLIDYDETKGAELVPTLMQYLECGRSYDLTAEALSVHRNTLKYRLRRIREISGRDLRDPGTCFNLQLATRAWATLLALRDKTR
jgi:DNA-binding PucR family transcriptional regulator